MADNIPMQTKVRDRCPRCSSTNLSQYRTEKFSPTYTVRYHRCRWCNFRFKTEESAPAPAEKPKRTRTKPAVSS